MDQAHFDESPADIILELKRQNATDDRENLGESVPVFGPIADVMGYMDRLNEERGFVNQVSGTRKPELIKRLKDLVGALNKFDEIGILRSPMQKMIHNYIVAAYLPNIFQGEDLSLHLEEISTIIDLESIIKTILFIEMPRRGGKTTSVAMVAAAIMVTQPSSHGLIYSIGARASKLLAKQINAYVKKICPEARFLREKGEEVEIRMPDGNTRSISCYPGSADVSLFFPFLLFFDLGRVCVCVFFQSPCLCSRFYTGQSLGMKFHPSSKNYFQSLFFISLSPNGGKQAVKKNERPCTGEEASTTQRAAQTG